MAVNLAPLPPLLPVSGIRVGTVAAGIRKVGRPDLTVFELPEGAVTSAVFTQNRFCAAPVILARSHREAATPRYLLINTGSANAGTGAPGLAAAERCCEALAAFAGVAPETVLPFSTGVIGETLPVDRLEAALPAALEALTADGWAAAATGIMTTDTAPKGLSVAPDADHPYTLTGIAKGAGMIRPDMATMLSFIATDAPVAPALLQALLREAVDRSFNRITIDGDTSTNDAVTLVATGQAPLTLLEDRQDPQVLAFAARLSSLCCHLAQSIVRDGEGATKFVTVAVAEARSEEEALQAAYTIAHSPLVKTALFAGDPNWGRILAALGRAGIDDLAVEGVRLEINGLLMAEGGALAPSYREADGAAVMKAPELTLALTLGRGDGAGEVWTTDFSYDYVKINAEYRS
ncbi:MAG: bifunctional glutamate N-acetyltransferase/amino-acid acetyltransferase ArgJ [Pseudomonadales bacterium]|nr:bifunctional glutamate N-acetyltransferase/amino-acid acetyltransferase ArgJ [Pseudomonadales bacterium]